jgi:hypothetical protein
VNAPVLYKQRAEEKAREEAANAAKAQENPKARL